MKKLSRVVMLAGIISLPLFFCACLGIRIMEHVQNPDYYFDRAYDQIERIHRECPGREGRPHHLHILVYDGSDGELIQLSVPLWLVRLGVDVGMRAAESDRDFQEIEERYNVDWRAIKHFDRIGPGLMVEVKDEADKILIWLK
jgi:hypothetical protein